MEIKILEYRNGIYQGETKNNKKHGAGILITDQGQIFVGNWKLDQLYGQCFIFVNNQQYGFGQFSRGQLQGYFIFRQNGKTFFSEYNMSRAINKMLLIDYEKQISQIIVHKSPIYEVLQQQNLLQQSEEAMIYRNLNIRFGCPSIFEYLQRTFCHKKLNFSLKSLHNGNNLFHFDHQSCPFSLGFSLNKNGQLVGYGTYSGEKLNGLGCKYQNTVRYEGMFENGFMNGIGLRYSQGKYSFGQFSNGNLVQSIFIDDRSNISEEKLKQYKVSEHLRSLWSYNAYIRKDILKFKGISELVFQINTQQEYMYPQNLYSPTKKDKSQNLALKMIRRDDFETKSSKSFLVKPKLSKNVQVEDDTFSQGNISASGLNAMKRFKF